MKKIGFFVILAFAVRVIAVFIIKLCIKNPAFYYSEFDVIALNILSGKGYTYPFHNTTYYFFGYPLYPYFLAVIHLLSNKSYLAIQLIQAAVASFSVTPLILIAKKIFNEKTALISGLLYCLHPGVIVYNVVMHEFTLMVFFLLTIIYLMVCLKIKKQNLVAIGVLIGLGLLSRGTIVFLIPAFFIYLFVKKVPIKKAFFNLFIIMLLAAIVISPWIYRGYRIYSRFIFINLTKAAEFWRGNNPAATGTASTEDGQPIFFAADEDFRKKLLSLNEIEQSRFFRDQAIEYIKTHPADFLKLMVRKFIYFWSFSPQTGLLYPKSWLIIYKLLYSFLAFFFILGIYFIFKNRPLVDIPAIVFLFSFFVLVSLIHSLYYVDTRHRWMIEPLLMIISSYGMVNLFFKKTVKAALN